MPVVRPFPAAVSRSPAPGEAGRLPALQTDFHNAILRPAAILAAGLRSGSDRPRGQRLPSPRECRAWSVPVFGCDAGKRPRGSEPPSEES
jgi:hypothetical protein